MFSPLGFLFWLTVLSYAEGGRFRSRHRRIAEPSNKRSAAWRVFTASAICFCQALLCSFISSNTDGTSAANRPVPTKAPAALFRTEHTSLAHASSQAPLPDSVMGEYHGHSRSRPALPDELSWRAARLITPVSWNIQLSRFRESLISRLYIL